MTSREPSPVRARRRKRSTRAVWAFVLLALAVVAVLAAFVAGSFSGAILAAVLATALGGGATRLIWADVVDARREWARDRAAQAQAYREITETRVGEQAVHDAALTGRITKHEATIARLEDRLTGATDEVRAAREELETERVRAQEAARRHEEQVRTARDAAEDHASDRARLSARLDDAESRAAEAIVRVAELEHELDVVLAEWRAGNAAPRRKHA